MGNPAVCLEFSQSCWECTWTGSSLLSFQPTVTHKEAGSRAQLSLKTQPRRLDVINEANASIDMLQVKPIDHRIHIDRRCELYNVSRAGGCETAEEEEGWRRLGTEGEGGGGSDSAESLRCAASEERGDSLLGPRAPGEGIRTCPDSQPPCSRQQGDEPPQQPLPPLLPQLKVWLSCRLERNKTQSTTTLSPYARGLGRAHTQAGTPPPLRNTIPQINAVISPNSSPGAPGEQLKRGSGGLSARGSRGSSPFHCFPYGPAALGPQGPVSGAPPRPRPCHQASFTSRLTPASRPAVTS
ncbi:hypothetical protein Q5P01_014308 [Channa striata]|uniref:Uncharacterized protein n=1 Tax=Channa striata TaxID=64152 RepID=A0AA88SGK4_CHASR|nr:hypothetical protein Q5P01_014308 [Channa striata]